MRRASLAILLGAGLLGLAGCVETVYPNGPPLRDVETEQDQVFLRCVVADPFFVTPTCRQVRAALSRDPDAAVTGR